MLEDCSYGTEYRNSPQKMIVTPHTPGSSGWCCAASLSSMRENEHNPENLLRRLNDRDVEMSVLLQRVGVLLEMPPKYVSYLDRRGTARNTGIESDDGCDLAKGELHVQRANKAGSLEALKSCLARMCPSQQQVSDVHGAHNVTSNLHFLHPILSC